MAHPSADVWSLGKLLKEIAPGISWHRAINHTLRPDPMRRPADAAAMLAIVTHDQRRKRITFIIGAIAIIIASVALFFSLRPTSISPTADSTASTSTDTVAKVVTHDTVQSLPTVSEETYNSTMPRRVESNLATPLKEQKDEYEIEHDRLMKVMHKSYSEVIKKINVITVDSAMTGNWRSINFIKQASEIQNELFVHSISFREKCPDEVLKRHTIEWGTPYDPELAGDYNRMKEAIRKRGQELGLNIDSP